MQHGALARRVPASMHTQCSKGSQMTQSKNVFLQIETPKALIFQRLANFDLH
jgi:hypothetical protein